MLQLFWTQGRSPAALLVPVPVLLRVVDALRTAHPPAGRGVMHAGKRRPREITSYSYSYGTSA
eukprot:scaffold646873_cov43-Prasinocladus_malaysianus.AAC.1